MPKGNSEYLVDTESNRVIYPYTLIDNIIGRDENGELVSPGSEESSSNIILGNSGIDSSTYIKEDINLNGRTFGPNSITTLYVLELPTAGIWSISVNIYLGKYTVNCNTAVTNDTQLCATAEDGRKCAVRMYSAPHGYLEGQMAFLHDAMKDNLWISISMAV